MTAAPQHWKLANSQSTDKYLLNSPEYIAFSRPGLIAVSVLFSEPYFSWHDLAQGGFAFWMQMFMG